MTSLHHNRVDSSSSSSSSRGIAHSSAVQRPARVILSLHVCVCVCVCDSATVVAQAATDPLLSLFTHTHTAHAVFTAPRPERHPHLISRIRCRPGGCETICPPPPMAVRRWQKSRRIYVRPRTDPQSAHQWWPSVAKLQVSNVYNFV